MTERIGQVRIPIPGGDAVLYTHPDLGYDSNDLFETLYYETPWEQRSVFIGGEQRPQPRLIAWFSDYSYSYSGIHHLPQPMTPLLRGLAKALGELTNTQYNGVLLNLYHDGRSSIGMHADDEPEFGPDPTIASLSLGSTRNFDFRIKDKSAPIIRTPLTHGSVLVMSGKTQQLYKHGIAKTKDDVGARINLTFRKIIS